MPKRKPTVFERTSAKVIVAKAAGRSTLEAAREAGIHRSSLYDWIAHGRAGTEPYATFLRAFDAASDTARTRRIGEARDERTRSKQSTR